MIKHDLLIVGGGVAGLRAALAAQEHTDDLAVLSKVHTLRSHSVAAQGGIAAPLGNTPRSEKDNWKIHLQDTVKGGDYLVDQQACRILTREAPHTVIELERMGVPFNRTCEGYIDQRPFGGHSFPRACFAADRTGHAILHTLYGENVKRKTTIYNEYFVVKLIIEENTCKGLLAYNLKRGEVETFHSKAVLLATGGCGQVYQVTSNGRASTGDGLSMILRAGLPLEDMEFVQFHPTGLYPRGVLITEAARGEGGHLLNSKQERFMERYAPQRREMAPRDIVTRAIEQEIQEGRGIDGDAFVHLDLRHLGKETIAKKLPTVWEVAKEFANLDPSKELIPVRPTAHYSMGGIPVDIQGRVMLKPSGNHVRGLYAAGECACVSVHGANRLGTNSLLEACLFGARAGDQAGRWVNQNCFEDFHPHQGEVALEEINFVLNNDGSERTAILRRRLKEIMTKHCGVFRDDKSLNHALQRIKDLNDGYRKEIMVKDKSKQFNTDLLEALELGHMLDFAEAIVVSALAREESRGAHYRKDFPQRDDTHWLKHTYVTRTEDGDLTLEYAPVDIGEIKPKKRGY